MTRQEEISYLRIALALQKIPTTDEICDRIIETHERVKKLKGKFSVKDAVNIELSMNEKYKQNE